MIESIIINLIGFIGAILLASELYFGIRKTLKISLLLKRVHSRKKIKWQLIESNEKLRSTSYTDEEINKLKNEIKSNYNSDIERIENEIAEIEIEHPYKIFKRGVLGLILILFSFIWQSYLSYSLNNQLLNLNNRVEKLETILSDIPKNQIIKSVDAQTPGINNMTYYNIQARNLAYNITSLNSLLPLIITIWPNFKQEKALK